MNLWDWEERFDDNDSQNLQSISQSLKIISKKSAEILENPQKLQKSESTFNMNISSVNSEYQNETILMIFKHSEFNCGNSKHLFNVLPIDLWDEKFSSRKCQSKLSYLK